MGRRFVTAETNHRTIFAAGVAEVRVLELEPQEEWTLASYGDLLSSYAWFRTLSPRFGLVFNITRKPIGVCDEAECPRSRRNPYEAEPENDKLSQATTSLCKPLRDMIPFGSFARVVGTTPSLQLMAVSCAILAETECGK